MATGDSMNIRPEEVNEIVKEYVGEVKNLQDCSERFAKADQSFSSWSGPTRQKLQEQMKNELPAFEELISVVESYGNTAQDTANRVIEVENELTRMLG